MVPVTTASEETPRTPGAASVSPLVITDEDGPDASYDAFLLSLLVKGPPPTVRSDDDSTSSEEGEELDIDALMLADGVSVTGESEEQAQEQDADGDEDDAVLPVESPQYLDVHMLQDILAKADLDIDAFMLRDILATEDFAALVHGDKTKNADGEMDLTPLLDVRTITEWASWVRARMSPATSPRDGAAEVAAIWAEILAGPKTGGPPPSWFNTVCAWFSTPDLPNDVEAPGAVPTVEVGAEDGPRWFARPRPAAPRAAPAAAPAAIPVAGDDGGEKDEEGTAAEDTVSESSRSLV